MSEFGYQLQNEGALGAIQVKIKEAATLLRMSERRLGILSRCGEIPSYKVGSTRYFRVDSLKDWVASQEQRSARRTTRRSLNDSAGFACALRIVA